MTQRRTRVKVCGLTSREDAAAAVHAGADAVGVVLADSPREVSLDEAARILEVVPPLVARVAVFVDPSEEEVLEAVVRLRLTAVQLHGDESPELCDSLPVPAIKAFRIHADFDFKEFETYRGYVGAVLLDTYVEGRNGGTGKPFAWDGVKMPDWSPVMVAGGLNPVNVAEAVRRLRPFGVDVSSGVEERPRVKDHLKIEAFMEAVRAVDEALSK